MPRSSSTSKGITTAGIHAPMVNFDTSTTSRTTPVATAPTPLTAAPSRQPGARSRRWRCTIPHWDSVNDVKTPTA